MPTRMVSQEDAGDIFTPQPDAKIAHLAEVAALQQMTDTLGRMGKFMQQLGEDQKILTAKVGEMHTDIALLRQSNERMDKLEKRQEVCDGRVTQLEMAHASDEGARKGLNAVREWAPLLLALFLALFTLFKTGAIHL